ncbi:hapless 2 isoform X3 [Hydra vulgaris]|uniref:Hapless 2 isoform X3 n=1 Tax=Hydra vulgaris TaxID=6087 RepID=A0ABM4CH61_HYDVU
MIFKMKIQLLLSFFNIAINITFVGCLILSKSSIEFCENTGLSNDLKDPTNVVTQSACEKKMVVLLSVGNKQGETEKLQAVVSVVQNSATNEFARLYNPFMITVSKSPVYLNFPFFFNGITVNNQPYEEIILSKNHWYVSDSSRQCLDQWQVDEDDDEHPTCGYQYINSNQTQTDGTWKTVKTRIWDSQGFCCYCTQDLKNYYIKKDIQDLNRANIICKPLTNSPQASAHCMRMSNLWYTLNEFTESYRDFSIYVKAFDQITKVVQNKSYIDYVNGGEIVLSPSQKSAIGSYNRITGNYVGDLQPIKSYPVLTNNYFLIPFSSTNIDPKKEPQLKSGISKWMIIPRDLVSTDAKQCDMIGVGYSAFRNQAAYGTGYGCRAKKGSCLANQPYNKFMDDEVSIPSCTSGVQPIEEKRITIDPQMTETITFKMMTSTDKKAAHDCTINLYDSKNMLLQSRNFTFSTKAPCVCEVQSCKCDCSEGGGVKCVQAEGKFIDNPNLFVPQSTGFFDKLWSSIKSFPSIIGNFFSGIFGSLFGNLVQYAIFAAIALVVICLCCNCGGFRLLKRFIPKFNKKGYKHLKLKRYQEQIYKPKEITNGIPTTAMQSITHVPNMPIPSNT